MVWCDGKSSISQLHLPFKLKDADGGGITLLSADGRWNDAMIYNALSSKNTVGRYPDGGHALWTFCHPTIGAHNMQTSCDSAMGSIPDAILSRADPVK